MNTFLFPNKPVRFYTPEKVIPTLTLADWLAQPKWDGHRALAHCDEAGRVTVFSRHGTPLTAGKQDWLWLATAIEAPRPWLLDGELLPNSKRMIIWDYAYLGGADETARPYEARLGRLLTSLNRPLRKGGFSIEVVETLEGDRLRELLARKGEPHLEGVVLKRKLATDLWGRTSTSERPSQLKYRF